MIPSPPSPPPPATVKICDFGSAVDPVTLRTLYTQEGGGLPSQGEETEEYMPPETVLNKTLPFSVRRLNIIVYSRNHYIKPIY